MAINLGSVLPGLGSALGSGFGQSFQQTLGQQRQLDFMQQQQQLAEQQKQRQAQQATQGLLGVLPGLDEKSAQSLLMMQPQALAKLLPQLIKQGQEGPLAGAHEDILMGQPPQANLIDQMGIASQNMGPQETMVQEEVSVEPEKQQQIAQLREQIQQKQPSALIPTPGLKASQLESQVNNYLQQRDDLNPLQKQQVREKSNKQIEKLMNEQEKINKRFMPFQEEVAKKGNAGKENLARLDEMQALVQRGNLLGSTASATLETLSHGLWGVGIDLFGLTGKDTQKFRKLQKDFIKNAKDVFGARVTEGEIKLLLDTFPSLSQSDEGKMAIIETLKPIAYGQQAMSQAAEEIAEKYNYNLPKNYRRLVQEEANKRRDLYAAQLKRNMKQLRAEQKEKQQARNVHPLMLRRNIR